MTCSFNFLFLRLWSRKLSFPCSALYSHTKTYDNFVPWPQTQTNLPLTSLVNIVKIPLSVCLARYSYITSTKQHKTKVSHDLFSSRQRHQILLCKWANFKNTIIISTTNDSDVDSLLLITSPPLDAKTV